MKKKSENLTRREFVQITGLSAATIAGLATINNCGKNEPKASNTTPLIIGKAKERPNNVKVRLAVAGGNFGSQFYFTEHPNCEVTAVTDLRPERKKKLMETYGCNKAYDSLEELLKKETNIDAVAIFTDGVLHYEHSMACLDKGYHVFCAVPACFTLEEAERLSDKVKSTGLIYMMAETSYYMRPHIFARELYEAGKFGELFYSEVEYYHDKGDLQRLIDDKTTRFWNPDGTPSWRWGLAPMNYPTHSVGNLIAVTGERITKVSCLGWGQNGEKFNDHPFINNNRYNNPFWNCASMMQTNKGHMSRVNVMWLVPDAHVRSSFMGTNIAFHTPRPWANKEQSVEYGRLKDSTRDFIEVPEYYRSGWLPEAMRHPNGHGDSHVFLTTEFIDSIVEKRTPKIDIGTSLAMTVPGIVAHESALKNGEQLTVPQFD